LPRRDRLRQGAARHSAQPLGSCRATRPETHGRDALLGRGEPGHPDALAHATARETCGTAAGGWYSGPVARRLLPHSFSHRSQDLLFGGAARDSALRAAHRLAARIADPEHPSFELRVPLHRSALPALLSLLDHGSGGVDPDLLGSRIPDGVRHSSRGGGMAQLPAYADRVAVLDVIPAPRLRVDRAAAERWARQ